jgi:NAD(P)-dependent dehydrogenase (short-subunit alcohol dehydrogenase family)
MLDSGHQHCLTALGCRRFVPDFPLHDSDGFPLLRCLQAKLGRLPLTELAAGFILAAESPFRHPKDDPPMNIDLTGKTAIVTGSTLGIGHAIAKGLAECGATVVVNGRKQGAVDKALAQLGAAVPGAALRGVAADLGTAEGCDALLRAEPAADILVNNLGIYGPKDFFEIADAEWARFFEVNVMSGVRLSRAYAPGMVERKWGRVIFLSSESALNIPPDMVHYGVTKTANLAVSRGLASGSQEPA